MESEETFVPEITNGWDTPVEFRRISLPGQDF